MKYGRVSKVSLLLSINLDLNHDLTFRPVSYQMYSINSQTLSTEATTSIQDLLHLLDKSAITLSTPL